MKRLLLPVLALVLCVSLLTGCSELLALLPTGTTPAQTTAAGEETTTAAAEETTTAQETTTAAAPQPAMEYYDTGSFKVPVPAGWKAFPQTDVFSDANSMDPNVINVVKGGQSDLDMLTKPMIRFDYYGPDRIMMGLPTLKDFYSDSTDAEPLQCGPYTWKGFTTEEYSKMAIMAAEDGDYQYQASIYLEVEGQTISLEDADVQAILAGVAPSGGAPAPAETTTAAQEETTTPAAVDPKPAKPAQTTTAATSVYGDVDDQWSGFWYGWWMIKNGSGTYAPATDIAWDAYAYTAFDTDGTGVMSVWDTGSSTSLPLFCGYDIKAVDGGLDVPMVAVFATSCWNNGTPADAMMDMEGWKIRPASSTVSHFENMLEITGHYASPLNPQDSFDYYLYLRPWGQHWEDVRGGDTSGCIATDMTPPHYDDWGFPLLQMGCEQLPASYEDGLAILEKGKTEDQRLDPADKAGADGQVDMDALQNGLNWCRENAHADILYDTIAARFGVHGRAVSTDYPGCTAYRWSCGDAFVEITFEVGVDGMERWYLTQSDGLE